MTDSVRNPADSVRRPAGSRPPSKARRASRLSLAAFLLALLLTATTVAAAVWWNAIDARFIAAADTAGWDERLLLPHQQLLWVAVNGAVVLSVVLTVVTFVALLRAHRSPPRALHAPAVLGEDR